MLRFSQISSVCKATHVAKVLQTMRSNSLLYQLPEGGEYLLVKLDIPCWLQCLGEGKGENYFRALEATHFAVPPEVLVEFRRRVHLVCTDADGAVDRCERESLGGVPTMLQL